MSPVLFNVGLQLSQIGIHEILLIEQVTFQLQQLFQLRKQKLPMNCQRTKSA